MPKAKRLPSGSYRTQIYSHTDDAGKKHYKSFTAATKKEAEYMAAEYALSAKNNVDKDDDSSLFIHDADMYIHYRSAVLSPATIREYKRICNNKLGILCDYPTSEITQEIIQSHINMLSKTLSPKSVRCIHGFIVSVLKQSRPGIQINTILPKKVRPKIYVPSNEDIKNLLSYVKDKEMELPILLAAFGSMRRGEISAFSKEDIKGNTLHINKTMVLDENKNWIVKAPKSYAGDRIVTLPEYIAQRLEPVNLTPEQITKKFAHVLHGAGLHPFRFHDCRHYYASVGHALGIPDQYIMQSGGWGNDGVLKSVYRHTMDEEKQRTNNIMMKHFDDICNT